jgi:hypothetical protein
MASKRAIRAGRSGTPVRWITAVFFLLLAAPAGAEINVNGSSSIRDGQSAAPPARGLNSGRLSRQSANKGCKLSGRKYVRFAGSSNLKLPVCFTITRKRRRLVELSFSYSGPCDGGGSFSGDITTRTQVAVARSGKFKASEENADRTTGWFFSGTIRRTRASGQLNYFDSSSGTLCQSGIGSDPLNVPTPKWTARRVSHG